MIDQVQSNYLKLVQYRKGIYEDFPQFLEPKTKKVKTQTAVQEEIEEQVQNFIKVFSNAELVHNKLSDSQSLLQKQRKRLKVKHSKITLNQLGFESISNGNNLYTLVIQQKVKILDFQADNMNMCKMILQANTSTQVVLEAGTLMYPDDQKAYANQTLVLRDDIKAILTQGRTQLRFETFCFNRELKAPSSERYLLGNIKSVKYERGMGQKQVWQITIRQIQVLESIQKLYERQDYVALTKTQIVEMLEKWKD